MQMFSVLMGLNLPVEADETPKILIDIKFRRNSAVSLFPYSYPGSLIALIDRQLMRPKR